MRLKRKELSKFRSGAVSGETRRGGRERHLPSRDVRPKGLKMAICKYSLYTDLALRDAPNQALGPSTEVRSADRELCHFSEAQ